MKQNFLRISILIFWVSKSLEETRVACKQFIKFKFKNEKFQNENNERVNLFTFIVRLSTKQIANFILL